MKDVRRSRLLVEMMILAENRIEFLRQKFVPILVAKWQSSAESEYDPTATYHQDLNFIVDHTPEQVFDDADQIDGNVVFDFIASFDPSRVKANLQWLLSMVVKHDMRVEDLPRAHDYLVVFDRVKGRMPSQQRDILRYTSLPDLWAAVQPFSQTVSQGDNDRAYAAEMAKQSDVVFNDANIKIVIPRTSEAAQFFGRNTQWCTSAKTNNMFDSYNSRGPLYIVLDKKNNRRWQFHFPSKQFMDENDSQIDTTDFCDHYPDVARFFMGEPVATIKWTGTDGLRLPRSNPLRLEQRTVYRRQDGDQIVISVKRNFIGSLFSFYTDMSGKLLSVDSVKADNLTSAVELLNRFAHGSISQLNASGIFFTDHYVTFDEIATPVLSDDNFSWSVAEIEGNSIFRMTCPSDGGKLLELRVVGETLIVEPYSISNYTSEVDKPLVDMLVRLPANLKVVGRIATRPFLNTLLNDQEQITRLANLRPNFVSTMMLFKLAEAKKIDVSIPEKTISLIVSSIPDLVTAHPCLREPVWKGEGLKSELLLDRFDNAEDFITRWAKFSDKTRTQLSLIKPIRRVYNDLTPRMKKSLQALYVPTAGYPEKLVDALSISNNMREVLGNIHDKFFGELYEILLGAVQYGNFVSELNRSKNWDSLPVQYMRFGDSDDEKPVKDRSLEILIPLYFSARICLRNDAGLTQEFKEMMSDLSIFGHDGLSFKRIEAQMDYAERHIAQFLARSR